jgi:hypothetical protein
MKFSIATTLFALAGAAGTASAFVPMQNMASVSASSSTTALQSSWQMPPAAGPVEFFPLDIPMKRIEGGGTVRTWDIPPETERLQYVVETNGRPLKAKVEL